jgi:hypothetical protein
VWDLVGPVLVLLLLWLISLYSTAIFEILAAVFFWQFMSYGCDVVLVCTDVSNDRNFFIFMVRLWKTAWPRSWWSVKMAYHTEDLYLTAVEDTSLTLPLTVYWHCCWHCTGIAVDIFLTLLSIVCLQCYWQFTDVVDTLRILLLTVFWHCFRYFADNAIDSLLTLLLTLHWHCCWQFSIAFDSLLTVLFRVYWHFL